MFLKSGSHIVVKLVWTCCESCIFLVVNLMQVQKLTYLHNRLQHVHTKNNRNNSLLFKNNGLLSFAPSHLKCFPEESQHVELPSAQVDNKPIILTIH